MKYLYWIDMEMSGLNPEKERILEVALVITNTKFEVLETYETIVYQDKSILNSMDDWCTKHHGESGLTAKVQHGAKEAVVEEHLISLFKKYDPKGNCILAGNSIGQDRKFIDKWMPKFAQCLHYRMLDVSSFKIVFENIYNKKFEKAKKHRAIDDILESLAVLKYYLQFLNIP